MDERPGQTAGVPGDLTLLLYYLFSSVELGDTEENEPYIRARLGTASHLEPPSTGWTSRGSLVRIFERYVTKVAPHKDLQ